MIVEKYNYRPLSRTTVDGKRHYTLPDGSRVPSVTTILDKTKPEEAKAALARWRSSVGQERAQQITSEAANRGTRMHTYLEHYVRHDDMKPLPGNPFAHASWFMAGQVILEGLGNINEYWGIEVPLYFSGLYAGTSDCVGVHNGTPAIVDFKQTNKPKRKEYIGDYFLQLAAYANAHNEMFDTDIRKGVIMMCCKTDTLTDCILSQPNYLEFIIEGDEFDHWSREWIKRVDQYYSMSRA